MYLKDLIIDLNTDYFPTSLMQFCAQLIGLESNICYCITYNNTQKI